MLIREIILENFMSYEYARIPLKPGLNVICGPNGAGKSSILLAISVALGQSYTERSRKLSDLIRWGKDSARVTLVFDNTPLKGRRPVPRFDVDYFRISRYIKRDGNYWFEANFEPVNRNEISEILGDFGLNPDNMLIIMHQNMMEEFGMTTPQQKLHMVEDAIGLGLYRSDILEAQQKLEQVLSEERSIKSLFDNAEQTLTYWKGEYEKYQQRQELLKEKDYLERELVWGRVIKQESILRSWELRIKRSEEELASILSETEETDRSVAFLGTSLKELRQKYLESFYTLLNQEKERVLHEAKAEVLDQSLQRLANLDWNTSIESHAHNSQTLEKILTDMKNDVASSLRLAKEQEPKAAKSREELTKLEDKNDTITQEYLEKRVRKGVLEFRQKMIREDIIDLTRELHIARRALNDLEPLIEKASPKVETSRTVQEISEDLKVLSVRLNNLGEVSQEVEKMYFHYMNILEELKNKAAIVDGRPEEDNGGD